ncbi:MAG: DUF2269 domain-containing protein [Azospirillum brasilense]|nr:MAG: DUF2269 domain-containing protein [Azospirillum brasilense]
MDYLLLKLIHILSATILFGTGIGSAFYLFMANRRKDIASIYFATQHVVIADWVFTTPSIIVQLITGVALAHQLGLPMTEGWVLWSLLLYFFAGACWLPVVWMQIRMRDMARQACEQHTPLPARYWRYDRWWIMLGSLAFPAVVVIIGLMVMKP